jgi:hypothetical protein
MSPPERQKVASHAHRKLDIGSRDELRTVLEQDHTATEEEER